MTEPIKQEIISCIYENGENLITGPVLQGVLLDMVDDTNAKVASGSVPGDLVNKTGSWDDAADWVEQNSSSVVLQPDLDGYATEQWVENQGYLKEHQDLGGYATTESLNDLSESVANDLANLPEPDLSDYATKEYVEATSASVKEWVESKHYLTTASLSGSVTEESVGFMIGDATASVKTWVGDQNYATETFVSESIAGLDIPSTEGFATTESLNSLSESVANDFANLDIPDVSGLATTESVTQLSESVAASIKNLPEPDLSVYATTASVSEATESVKTWVQEQGYLTEHQDISGLATTSSVNQLSESVAQTIENLPQADLSGYLQTSSYLEDSASFDSRIKDAREEATTAITNVSEGVVALSASFDQRINSITGSEADLSGYATTASVNQLSSSVANDFANLDIPDVSGYATTQSVNTLSASFAETIDNIPGTDLTGYATEQWVQNQGYLTEHQDISGLATTSSVNQLSSSVSSDIQNARTEASQAITGLGTIVQGESDRVTGLSASFDNRINNITGSSADLSGYATTASVNQLSSSVAEDFANLNIPDVSGYATTESVNQLSSSVATDIQNARTEAAAGFDSVNQGVVALSASFDQRINDLPGGEKIWVRGTGSGSAVLSGSRSTASGKGSVAEGELTKASGNYSHAEGYKTTASGGHSHAEGSYTIALEEVSHAEGTSTVASGWYSHAEGRHTTASGEVSHAEGTSTVASGWYSHAEGSLTTALGDGSHAEGSGSKALGTYSHAEGLFTTASGTGSHAQGLYTIVNNEYEVGIGKFNTGTDQNHRDRIFSLGVGTDDSNRKDAIVVYTGSVGPRILVYGVGGYDGTNPDSAKTLAQTISEITGSDLSGYATTASVNQISYSVDYRLDQLEQEKEIPFWSSGSGEYSVVRKNGSFAEAMGEGSIFLGYGGGRIVNYNYYRCEYSTWAPSPSDSNPKYYLSHEVNSSQWDRVEVGQNLVSGNDHLGRRVAQVVSKGQDTSGETAGMYWITLSTYVGTPVWLMLVEVGSRIAGKGAIGGGCGTDTSNDYETGLGKYSRSGSGQIFSVGVGSSKTDRRNAISIVTGSNPSASVYIYGVGSYDGTNPQPGTNDLASVIASGGGSGVDTALRNFLFGVESQTLTGITGSCTNIYSVVSSDTTLGFSAVPDNGTSLGIIIKNEGGSNATITLPDTVTVGSTTYNLITNGVDNSGSMSIPSGEYGDIVVTRQGTDLFVRTSINLEDIDINLSGYATTESVNTLSASFDQRISSIPGSDIDLSEYATTESVNTLSASFAETIDNIPTGSGASGNYLPITGGTLTGNLFVGGNNSIGVGSTKVGIRSLTVGDSATSTQDAHYGLAVGENCGTNVYGGVALGRETRVVSEPFGVAVGFRTRVDKMSGFAGGCLTTASGQFSFAAGFGAVSKGTGQVVLGSFNEIDGTGTGTGSYAVILGNGKSSTWNQDNPGDVVRSNGLAIKWDGGVDINYSGSTITLQNKIAELEATIAGLVARIEALEGSN